MTSDEQTSEDHKTILAACAVGGAAGAGSGFMGGLYSGNPVFTALATVAGGTTGCILMAILTNEDMKMRESMK